MSEPKNLLSLCTTPLKLRILKVLEKPMKFSQIADELGVSRETIKPHIRSFVESGLIERKEGKYALTIVGKVVVEKAFEIESLMTMSDELKEFLTTHDLSSIPEQLLKDLHKLGNGFIVKSRDPFEISNEWVEVLRKSSWLKGYSSVYHPEFPGLFTELAEGRDMELILSKEVFEKCLKRDANLLRRYLELGRMFVGRSEKIAFVVAEKGFVMGLYVKGVYDASNIYVSESGEAVEWGLRLFDHYLANSRKVEP